MRIVIHGATGHGTPALRKLPKPARFGPRQNAAKSKVFAWLYYWTVQNQEKDWYSIRTLYLNTGVNPNYLQQRLPLWVRWRYLKKRGDGYRLDRKGREFVERLLTYAPDMCNWYMKQTADFRRIVESMDPSASCYKSLNALTKAIKRCMEEMDESDSPDDEDTSTD